ncbi:MAG TPA: GNAT family N-acetyltransferase [Rubrobacteraceae bacterium]|nr:GNAT family N-acetyltransferase [Rubrobacteraceae bacterium]
MRVERHFGIGQVDGAAWRALEPPNFPFFDHEFLRALERSRSIGRRSGWSPVYLVCGDGREVLGALPLYLKTDSYGEYVFDWEWAHAYREHGLSYYPKLVSAVPFTPATGPKLLVRPGIGDAQRAAVKGALLDAARGLASELGVSSSHALFLPEEELDEFEGRGYAIRHSLQFHWRNRGYGAFPDYLDAMTSKRRRQVARERRQLEGVTIERLTGESLAAHAPEHAALMYRFYLDTYDRKWGSPYLTGPFFTETLRTMADRTLLVLARDELSRRPVASALFFFKGRNLYGRYWGAIKDVRNLHFELCYYQGIEFAIERGLELFEAGAQGEHKLARGFLPTITYSAHEIRHPAFERAIGRFIAEEREYLALSLEEYAHHDPYKR